MRCAHCGHEHGLLHYFRGRPLGGWRCSACRQIFYVDHSRLKPLPYTQLQSLAVIAGFMMIVAFALVTPSASYLVVAALLILVGAASTRNMQRALASPTETTRPSGQRQMLGIQWTAMTIYFAALLSDTLIVGRLSSIASFQGVVTIFGSVVFIALMYRISRLDRLRH